MKRIVTKERYETLSIESRATIWFVVCNCIQKGITAVTIPIFTRLMAVDQYGIYSAYHTWTNMLTVVITLNLSAGAYNNAMLKFKEHRDAFTSSMQALVTCMAFVWGIIYLVFMDFWNAFLELPASMVLCMFIEILLNSAFSFWAAKERYEYRYRVLVITTISYAVSTTIIPAFAVSRFADEGSSAYYRALSGIFALMLSYGWIWIYIAKKGKTFFSKEFWGFGLKFNIPLIPHYLAMSILGQIDRVMIKKMVGDTEAGIYTVAYTIAICLQVFTTALNQGFAPWLYRKIDNNEIEDITGKINKLLMIMGIMVVYLSLLAPEAIKILATPDYYDAMYIIAPVAGSTFFIFVFQLLANFEFFYYKNGFIAIASSVAALVNLILNYIFIKVSGYFAAGYTTLASYAILALMHCVFVVSILKKNGIKPNKCIDIGMLFMISTVITLESFAVLALYTHAALRILLSIALLIFIYLKGNPGSIEKH